MSLVDHIVDFSTYFPMRVLTPIVQSYSECFDESRYKITLGRWQAEDLITDERRQELSDIVGKALNDFAPIFRGMVAHRAVGLIVGAGYILRPTYTLLMKCYHTLKGNTQGKELHNGKVMVGSVLPVAWMVFGYPSRLAHHDPLMPLLIAQTLGNRFFPKSVQNSGFTHLRKKLLEKYS